MQSKPSKASIFYLARHARDPFVYEHRKTGSVMTRAMLLAIIGAAYTDGERVRASDFRPVPTWCDCPWDRPSVRAGQRVAFDGCAGCEDGEVIAVEDSGAGYVARVRWWPSGNVGVVGLDDHMLRLLGAP